MERWNSFLAVLSTVLVQTTTSDLNLQDLEGDWIKEYVDGRPTGVEKCPLTKLEMDIKRFDKFNPTRLKDLKKRYPNDEFTDIVGDDCEGDFSVETEICEKLAFEGHCNGTNIQVTSSFKHCKKQHC